MVFVSFKKVPTKTSASISSWIKQTVILCYELSDQEAHSLYQVKTHDVRVLAAPMVFQSGVSWDLILSACHWSHIIPSHSSIWRVWFGLSRSFNNWAWYGLLSRSTIGPSIEEICIYVHSINSFFMCIVKNVMCFLWEVYWHSGTELIPLFPLPQSRSVKRGGGGGQRRYKPG